MKRFATIGALLGGLLGTAFALAVVSFADCAGPACGRERVLGVLLHAALGSGAGTLLGALAAWVRRWWSRAR